MDISSLSLPDRDTPKSERTDDNLSLRVNQQKTPESTPQHKNLKNLEQFFRNQFDGLDSDKDSLLNLEEVAEFIQYNYDVDEIESLQEAKRLFQKMNITSHLDFSSFVFAFTQGPLPNKEMGYSSDIIQPPRPSDIIVPTIDRRSSYQNDPLSTPNPRKSPNMAFTHSEIESYTSPTDISLNDSTASYSSHITDEMYNSLKDQLLIWKNRAEWLADRNQRLQDTLSSEQKQFHNRLASEGESIETQIQMIKHLEREKLNLTDQLRMQQQLESSKSESHKRTIQDCEARIIKLKESIDEKNASINDMKTEIHRVDSLKGELLESRTRISEFERRFLTKKEEISNLLSQLNKQNEENASLTIKLNETKSQRDTAFVIQKQYIDKYNEVTINYRILKEKLDQIEKNPISVNEVEDYFANFSESDSIKQPLIRKGNVQRENDNCCDRCFCFF